MQSVPANTLIDSAEASRLRWQCRRGLLENDLFIDRFFSRMPGGLTRAQAQGLRQLMALSDPDLLDLFLARKELEGDDATVEAIQVLTLMRVPPQRIDGTEALNVFKDPIQAQAGLV